MKNIVVLLFPLFFLFSCEPKFDFGDIDFEPQIIVEGWIENGGFANVILTQSMTMSSEMENTDFKDIPLRWAKVTVSDGNQTEILTGKINKNYSPPFIYSGVRIKGVPGNTYYLKVEYSGRTVTAVTTIPDEITGIDRIYSEKCKDSDSLFQVKIEFKDNLDKVNYYKMFTRLQGAETRYYSSFLGTIKDDVLPENGNASITVNRGLRYGLKKKYTPFFKENDTVFVKLAQIDEAGFDFWSGYENEVTNGKNPLFPSSSNLKSNVVGGKGVWCGYTCDIKSIIIKR